LHELSLLFPADATAINPAATALATASLTAVENVVLSDMTMTPGGLKWARTQSSPPISWLVVPEPLQPRTWTGTMVAFLAAPYVMPAATLATCVPWLLQSGVRLLLFTVLQPCITRPPKSTWVARTPVSRM
jgi:hypothetical protein